MDREFEGEMQVRRDMDLVRRILIDLESVEDPSSWDLLAVDGYEPEVVAYHVKLLAEAGLVDATDTSDTGGFEWIAHSLTWEGHEFLDAARSDTTWNRVLSYVSSQGGSVPFTVLQSLLVKWAMSAANLG